MFSTVQSGLGLSRLHGVAICRIKCNQFRRYCLPETVWELSSKEETKSRVSAFLIMCFSRQELTNCWILVSGGFTLVIRDWFKNKLSCFIPVQPKQCIIVHTSAFLLLWWKMHMNFCCHMSSAKSTLLLQHLPVNISHQSNDWKEVKLAVHCKLFLLMPLGWQSTVGVGEMGQRSYKLRPTQKLRPTLKTSLFLIEFHWDTFYFYSFFKHRHVRIGCLWEMNFCIWLWSRDKNENLWGQRGKSLKV